MRNIVGIFALLGTILSQSVCANSGIFVNKDEEIAGLLQSTYVNMWWQWAVSMPQEDSPIRDKTGEFCQVNQSGPVWFLAGGYGSSRIHRECSIPSDKHIFFPVINLVQYPGNKQSHPTCESVKKSIAITNNHVISFKVEVDDRKLVNPVFYRVSSMECFDLALRMPETDNSQRVYPAATDGYWVMLKPLAEGDHHIKFRAEYGDPSHAYGRMIQDIEYDIKTYVP